MSKKKTSKKGLREQWPPPLITRQINMSKETYGEKVRERALAVFETELWTRYPKHPRFVSSTMNSAKELTIIGKLDINPTTQTLDYDEAMKIIGERIDAARAVNNRLYAGRKSKLDAFYEEEREYN